MPTSIRKYALWFSWVIALALWSAPAIAQDETDSDKPAQQEKEAPEIDEDAQKLLAEGQELIGSGDYAEAAAKLRECVEADENLGIGWFLLGYALHMDGKLEEALKMHQKAAEFDGQFKAIATYNIGCAEALLGRPGPALEALRKAVDLGFTDTDQIRTDSDLFVLHPTTDFAKILATAEGNEALVEQLDKAQTAIGEENFEEAATIYKEILEKDKNNAFACYRLGYALHGAGKLDEAIEYHQRATKFAGTRGIANYNWACALSLKDDKEAALKRLKEAVKHGFVRLDAYQNDPDLDNLREEQEFKDLVAGIEAKMNEKSKATSAEKDAKETARESRAEAKADSKAKSTSAKAKKDSKSNADDDDDDDDQ